MNGLRLVDYSSVAIGIFLVILAPVRARAATATITTFMPPLLPTTSPLTPEPAGTFQGYNAYRFKLSNYFLGSPNPLPEAVFTENEFSTHLILTGGFVSTGGLSERVDPITDGQDQDQMVEFSIAGEYWLHHLTLTLHAQQFPIFSADSVNLKGFVRHLVAPHPEQEEHAPGPDVELDGTVAGNNAITPPPSSFMTADQLRRELERRGVNLPAQGRFGLDANSLLHASGSDEDLALALLVAEAPGPNAGTFDWYLVATAADHPVPEPAGFVLLVSSLFMAFGCRQGLKASNKTLPLALGRG